MSLLTLLNDELILKVCVYANSPRTLTDPPGGYAAAQALSATCLAMSLVSTIYADRCETDEEAAWERLGLLEQGVALDEIQRATRDARLVVRQVAQCKAEEEKKIDAAFADIAAFGAWLANAATKKDDPLELLCGARAKFIGITGKGSSQCYHLTLCDDAAGVGNAGQVVSLKKDQIKPEYLPPTNDAITKSACCKGLGFSFPGSVTSAGLLRHRGRIDELAAGIERRCVLEVTYNGFQAGHAAFVAACEAAPTEAARLSLIKMRAEALKKLPTEPIVRGKKSRLGPLVKAISDAAGPGFVFNDREIMVRVDAIIGLAEAELAKRPLEDRRDDLVGRRQAANREPEDVNKQLKLVQQIRGRAPAIPTKPSFTRMDAAAHERARDYQQRLWSAPEGQPRRNPVASRRFQLPLSPNIDLGHLVDALREGLSFLMPTSEIEVPSPEQLVASMEIAASSRYAHLYPVNK